MSLGLNEEIEKDILSLCFTDTEFFLDVHEYLKPEHLVGEETSKIWLIVTEYFNHYHTVPKISRVKHLVKSKYSIELDEEYFADKSQILDRDFLLSETIKLIRNQEMRAFILDAAEEADKENPNYDSLESGLRKVLSIEPVSDLGTFYFDLDERFERIKSMQVDRIPTGIEVIDNALDGGLAAKELIAVAAPPGAGKSYLLAISGANILLEKKNVVHYTLEMSEERVSMRYDMALLNMTTPEIMSDIKDTKERLKFKQSLINKHLVIKEFPTYSATVNTIRNHLNKLKEQKGFVPDLIIVDYGDIMKATRSYSSRYEEQGAVFRELRGLAQEQDVPLLTATQTNRGSMSKDLVTMEDLGDSFDKARIMDGLFVIIQKPEEKEDGLMRLYEAKVRNGASGRIFGYKIDYARAQLELVGEVNTDDE